MSRVDAFLAQCGRPVKAQQGRSACVAADPVPLPSGLRPLSGLHRSANPQWLGQCSRQAGLIFLPPVQLPVDLAGKKPITRAKNLAMWQDRQAGPLGASPEHGPGNRGKAAMLTFPGVSSLAAARRTSLGLDVVLAAAGDTVTGSNGDNACYITDPGT